MVQRSFKPGENVAVEIQPHCIPYVKTEGVQTIATAWGVKVEGLRDRVDGFLEHNTVSLHRPNMGFVLYVSPTTNNASLG
jgi:hypothetical protein